MATLMETAVQLVTTAAQLTGTPVDAESLLEQVRQVYAGLRELEAGRNEKIVKEMVQKIVQEKAPAPTSSMESDLQGEGLRCQVCGKGGFKLLARHISLIHGIKPSVYRKMYGIPRGQALMPKSYSEKMKQRAEERGIGEILAKGRHSRQAQRKEMEESQSAVPGPDDQKDQTAPKFAKAPKVAKVKTPKLAKVAKVAGIKASGGKRGRKPKVRAGAGETEAP